MAIQPNIRLWFANPYAARTATNGEITVTIFGFIFKFLAIGFNILVKKGLRL
jgi:hypothetical protein